MNEFFLKEIVSQNAINIYISLFRHHNFQSLETFIFPDADENMA